MLSLSINQITSKSKHGYRSIPLQYFYKWNKPNCWTAPSPDTFAAQKRKTHHACLFHHGDLKVCFRCWANRFSWNTKNTLKSWKICRFHPFFLAILLSAIRSFQSILTLARPCCWSLQRPLLLESSQAQSRGTIRQGHPTASWLFEVHWSKEMKTC